MVMPAAVSSRLSRSLEARRLTAKIGGYFHPLGMQTTPANADDPQFGTSTKFGRYLGNATYEGDAEIGGYVPLRKLKDHPVLFWQFQSERQSSIYGSGPSLQICFLSTTASCKDQRRPTTTQASDFKDQ